MQYSELSLKICNIIANILLKEVIPSASLVEDCGLDCLDYIELTIKLENDFDISIDNNFTKCTTVENVIQYVAKCLNI